MQGGQPGRVPGLNWSDPATTLVRAHVSTRVDLTRLDPFLSSLGLDLPEQARDRIGRHAGLVLAYARRANLTAQRTPLALVDGNVADGLALAALIGRSPPTLADVGSGGGYPGLVLAIVWPSTRVVLVEASLRKGAFLAEAARSLGLTNVRVEDEGVEALVARPGGAEGFAAVTARALAPLARALTLAMPLVEVGGRLYVPCGPRPPPADPALLEALGARLVGAASYTLPGSVAQTLLSFAREASSPPPGRAGPAPIRCGGS